MKRRIAHLWIKLSFILVTMNGMSGFLHAAISEVTFIVDLQGAGIQPSVNGVHLAGNFQDVDYDGFPENPIYVNWDPSGIVMLDQGNGQYSVTLMLEQGHYEFKFVNGNQWGEEESVPAICAMGMVANGNRYLEVNGQTETYRTCYSGAGPCGSGGVLFLVDMSAVDSNENGIFGELTDISPEGVHIAGSFGSEVLGYSSWDPAALKCTHQGNGIYAIYLTLSAGYYEYKFLNGNAWGSEESATGSCFFNGNRNLSFIGQDLMLPALCFGSCGFCSQSALVTFRVDMSQQTVSPNGVQLAGSFQGWNPADINWKMVHVGSDIYEITKGIPAGYYEFKVVNGNAWSGIGNDNEQVPLECSQNGNRFATVIQGEQTLSFCYNQCTDNCVPASDSSVVQFQVNLNEWMSMNTMSSDVWVITSAVDFYGSLISVLLSDSDGDGVYSGSASCYGPASIYYRYVIGDSPLNPLYSEGSGLTDCMVNHPSLGPSRFLLRSPGTISAPLNCFDRCFNCQGCMDQSACNFNGMATWSAGCQYLQMWYIDQDMDGYGNDATGEISCDSISGYRSIGGDCNDGNALIFPSQSEFCNALDDDCDGNIDEAVTTVFYLDGDGDGFGNASMGLGACTQPFGYVNNNTDCDDAAVTYLDVDNDGQGGTVASSCGVYNSIDCDDSNANVNTTMNESCNGLDDNCNFIVDEGLLSLWFADADGDGFGNSVAFQLSCTTIIGYVTNSLDCNDALMTYLDADNDGFGSDALSTCGVANSLDCDDDLLTFQDFDGDGFGSLNLDECGVLISGDCNDQMLAIYPGASETCNQLDDDCDGEVDQGLAYNQYADQDGDGVGSNEVVVFQCTPINGYLNSNGDCNDANFNVNPSQAEVCNGIDDDCDNAVDDGVLLSFFEDADMDGFGNPNQMVVGCNLPSGYVQNSDDCNDAAFLYADGDGDSYGALILAGCGVTNAEDCDDNDALNNPGLIETCNQLDDNCNGEIDEFVVNTYYADADADGFGNPNAVLFACTAPVGYVSNFSDCTDNSVSYLDADLDGFGNDVMVACGDVNVGGDCNSSDPTVYPGAQEFCNDVDDNCNGVADENLLNLFYFDADQDGFGDALHDTLSCVMPIGFVQNPLDCNDAAITYLDLDLDGFGSGVAQACGTVFNQDDCDDGAVLFEDLDADGFGTGTLVPCGGSANNLDCNDQDAFVFPSQTEFCDNQDQNCNGEVDEGVELFDYYLDMDGDGFGAGESVQSCENLSPAFAFFGGDCDDANMEVFPTQIEWCDETDQNCNGTIDEGLIESTYFADADGDGYGAGEAILSCLDLSAQFAMIDGDCDDADGDINPGQEESCDQVDENCNGLVDENLPLISYYLDLDGDGYGSGLANLWCESPGTGYTEFGNDCDDTNLNINPAQTEILDNGVDENCDGMVEVGLDEQGLSQWSFYPNPACQQVVINGSIIADYRICDAAGKLVLTGVNLGKGKQCVDISHLESGMYFLSVLANDVWQTRPLEIIAR